MPIMNGFEFVRQVVPLLPNTKIIFMTAFEITKSEFAIVHPSIRIDGFISKPFSTEQLCKIIEKQFVVSSNSQ
jgi:two-component SAPR family response regulator